MLDARDVGDDSVSDVEGLDVMDVGNWDDFEMAYWYLFQNPNKYKTVIIDTLSQVQQMAINKTLVDHGQEEVKVTNWGTMTKQKWGEVGQAMKTAILNWRDLPLNVVFIAQDRVFGEESEDETLIEPEVGPALSPATAKFLNASVSVILNTFIRQHIKRVKIKSTGKIREKKVIQFCMRVGPNSAYVTKVRKPKKITLPDIIVDPEYNEIESIIRGQNG